MYGMIERERQRERPCTHACTHTQVVCKDALRAGRVTQLAGWCCDVGSPCFGGKRSSAVNSLRQLERKLGLDCSYSAKMPVRKLTADDLARLRSLGCLDGGGGKARRGRTCGDVGGESEGVAGATGGEEWSADAGGEGSGDGSLEKAMQSLRDSVGKLCGKKESDTESVGRLRGGAGGKDKDATGKDKDAKRGKRTGAEARGSSTKDERKSLDAAREGMNGVAQGGVRKYRPDKKTRTKLGVTTIEIQRNATRSRGGAMISRRDCVVRKAGKSFCFAQDAKSDGGGDSFFISRGVYERRCGCVRACPSACLQFMFACAGSAASV